MAEPRPPAGFVRSLFAGRLNGAAILPFPEADPETRETTEEIVRMVGDWASDAIDPAAIDHAKTIPPGVIEGMKEIGLFGLTIPEEYGGAGMGQETYARVIEVLAHRCASTVTVLGAHLGIGLKALLMFGTPEQKARWLPSLATGERLAAFALTEAGAGSVAAAIRTSAEPSGGGWRLTGRKIWITNGGVANVLTVFARTPTPERPDAPLMERPISAFFVPTELEGVSVGIPEDKMGLCGSSTTEIGFEDVALPPEALIGPLGRGFKIALEVLNAGRHGLAAGCIGQAKLARELAVSHARERVQFGQPIARFGMVREMLAEMEADIFAMEAQTHLTAGLMDLGGRDTMLEAACCKVFATERHWEVANDALQVTGGTGFMREYPFERILRDARINMIFEGTNQVLRLLIATQGLRMLEGGGEAPGPNALEGVHPALDAERRVLERSVPELAESARGVLEEHGAEARHAQHDLHRLSEMAVALFAMGAVLSRVSSGDRAPAERELDLARLACARAEQAFRQAREEEAAPPDELVDRVARRMTDE